MVWQFVIWWCSLFGIVDPQGIHIVWAVMVGGLLLAAIYFITAIGLAVVSGQLRRP